MNGIFFYIGLGIGLAAACGLRPFLPVLLAGALSCGRAGRQLRPRPFHFLQSAGGSRSSSWRWCSPMSLQLLSDSHR
jgi:hypothetical protein